MDILIATNVTALRLVAGFYATMECYLVYYS